MNEKFNENAKVEQLNKVVLSHGEEKGLIVKDPYTCGISYLFRTTVLNIKSYFIISFKHSVEKRSVSIVLHFVVFFIHIFKYTCII